MSALLSKNNFWSSFLKFSIPFIFLLVIFFGLHIKAAYASTYYWTGAAGASVDVATNWSTTANAACGVSTGGAVPGPSDTAIFDSTCRNNAALNKSGGWSVAQLNIQSGYTGTVTQTVALTVSDTLIVAAGTLAIAGNNVSAGVVQLTGGTISGTTGVITGTSYDMQSGTVSAILGGTGVALTKTTAGAVVLSGTNTYSGDTTLNAGTLYINNSKAIGSGTFIINGGTINSNSGYTWTNNNAQIWNGDFTYSSVYVISTGVGQVTLGGNVQINTTAGTLSVGGAIGDSGSGYGLIKSGAGALALSGTNTYSGDTTLNAGTLYINNSKAIGSGTFIINGGTINSNNGYTLTNNNAQIWNGNFTYASIYVLNTGTGSVTLGGNVQVTASNGALIVGGAIGDLGSGYGLTKAGTAVITLSGTNTYSGGTTLNSGSLNINSAYALGAGPFTIAGGTIGNTSGGTITLLTNNTQNWNGNFTYNSANNLNLGTGDVVLGADIRATISNANLTVGGAISGVYSLTKEGAMRLVLSGTNSYSGGTILNNGWLDINSPYAIGVGPLTITSGYIGNTSGGAITLLTNNVQNWNGTFTYNSSYSLNMGTGDVTLGKDIRVTTSNANLTVGGAISGSYGFIKDGSYTLILSGVNTYTGTTTLTTGKVQLSNPLAAQNSTVVVNIGNGLSFGTGIGTFSIGALSGANSLALTDTGGGAVTLQAGSNNSDSTYSGILSGAGSSFVKQGSGTLTLSGLNTYTGTTAIANGTVIANKLQLTSNNSSLGNSSSAVTLGDASHKGTLSYTGGTAAYTRGFTVSAGGGEMDNTTGTLTIQTTGIISNGQLVVGGEGDISITSDITGGSLTKVGIGTLSLSNTTTLDGGVTISAGNITAGAGSAINLAGNWVNDVGAEGFIPSNGTVTLNGTNQQVLGTTTFYNLTKTVSSPDTLTFGASQTQIIQGTLNLQGAASNLLSLRSSVDNTQWMIDPQGARTISYLDVKDSNNINAIPMPTDGNNIVLTGNNNTGWGSVTATAPDAPTLLTATSGNAQVTLVWAAPADGGSAITDYVIDFKETSTSTWTTFSDGVSTVTSTTVSGVSLVNGTSYDFRVSAVNDVGQGAASDILSATPVTVPDAPTIDTTIAGNAQVTVTFFAPASNGGSEITGYTVTSIPGGGTDVNAGSTTLSHVVTGLTNGTSYTFTVTATNAMGTGAPSAQSNSVTPATVPDAPTAISAAPGNAQVILSWSAPTYDGGSAITDYIVDYKLTSTTTWTTFSDSVSTATSTTVAGVGLVNGSSYDFQVSAVNVAGRGTASSPAVSSTPLTTPDAPTSVTATRGDTQAIISFSAPASNGGSEITSYTVTSNPGNFTVSSSTSPITVTGLTNGTSYTFTVTATNAAGTGPASSASSPVTPATVPDAPTSPTATAGNAQASVAFIPPASDGGSEITSYTVTSNPGNLTGTGASSPITVAGLTNGTPYTFTVVATNDVGASSPSVPSVAVTPMTVPGAPIIGTAIAGNAQATVTFSPPVSNGGSVITGYTVTSSGGGSDSNAGSTSLSHIVTGLTNGTSYTFTVKATNSVGEGPASESSNSATPVTIPDSPTALAPTAGNAQVALIWSAPAINGGAVVTDYIIDYKLTASSSPTDWRTFADGISANTNGTVTGLANGSSYDFRVSAYNVAGQGSASSIVTAVPVTVPDAPTGVSAVAGNAQATVTFSAPALNGGSEIIGYTVTSIPSGGVDSDAGSNSLSHVVTGLTNGTSYTFTVTATNAVGTGSASGPSVAVIPMTIPGAPTSVSAVEGNRQATVSFTAPVSNGGSEITSYTITSSPENISTTTTTTTGVVTGLTNGSTYTFTVTAANAVGTGLASAPSNSVRLSTEPDAPVNLAAAVLGSSISLSWSAPASNGGSAVIDYIVEYQLTTGGEWSVFADGTSVGTTATVNGLSNGSSYDFRVRAKNIIGPGLPSASVTATPGEPAQVHIESFTDLTAPSIGTAVRITNEGLSSYEYQYTWCVTDSSDNLCGGGDDLFSATAAKLIQSQENWDTTLNSTVAVPGNYWFHLKVLYGSQSSVAVQSFTAVATYPDAPTSVVATRGNAQASVAFNAPASNGGSAITSYTVISSPGGLSGTGNASPIVVTGLTNGTAYTFTVTATNAVGTGQASVPSNEVTPMTVPDAPTGVSAVAGNAQVALSWTAPINTGGSPITDYIIEFKPSTASSWEMFADGQSTLTTATVTGLTNNLSYDFRVSAANIIGRSVVGSASATLPDDGSTPVTPPVPPTPPVSSGGGRSGGGFVSTYQQPKNLTDTSSSSPVTTSGTAVSPGKSNVTPSKNTQGIRKPQSSSPAVFPVSINKNEVSATPTDKPALSVPLASETGSEGGVAWVLIIVSVGLVFVAGFAFFVLRRRKINYM